MSYVIFLFESCVRSFLISFFVRFIKVVFFFEDFENCGLTAFWLSKKNVSLPK